MKKKGNIFRNLNEVTEKMQTAIENNYKKGGSFQVNCSLENEKETIDMSLICYITEPDFVSIILHLPETIDYYKILPVLELNNLINQWIGSGYIFLNKNNNCVMLAKMISICDGSVDKDELKDTIFTIFENGSLFFPSILQLLHTNIKPKDLLKEFWKNCIHKKKG